MSIILILSLGLHYSDRQIFMNLEGKERTDLQQIITELTKIERQIVKLRNNHIIIGKIKHLLQRKKF